MTKPKTVEVQCPFNMTDTELSPGMLREFADTMEKRGIVSIEITEEWSSVCISAKRLETPDEAKENRKAEAEKEERVRVRQRKDLIKKAEALGMKVVDGL